jgi:hypothetical protein
MTLLLGMVHPMHAVVISDRRLTVNGRLLDDESGKMFTLACLDARVAFAYTGLAATREFETRPWLLKTMVNAATHDPHLQPMLDYLRTVATATFADLRFPDKRLSVMCVGYRYDGQTNEIMAMVSNYDGFGRSPSSVAASEFVLEYSVDGPSVAAGNVLGAEIAADDLESLQELLRSEQVPASALVGKGVEAIRRAADRSSSRGRIGKQCLSVVLPSDASRPASPGYHSEAASHVTHGLAHVEARRGPQEVFSIDSPQLEIHSDERPIPLAGPKLRPTAPCWCGSSEQFRNCHGRSGG